MARSARTVGAVDIVAGLVLSVLVFVLVHVHLFEADPHGTTLAGLLATTMTLPVVIARRWPVPAAGLAAAGAVANWLLVGDFIRCGAALPAVFWIACVLGLRVRNWTATVGMAFVLVDVVAQCLSDPELNPATIAEMVPFAGGFWFVGRVIRSRADAVMQLAEQNAQIAATRERTAELAVATDRERIAAGLDGLLQRQIGGIAAQAADTRAHLQDQDAVARFAAIAADGRETLVQMREVVGSLRAESTVEPQPDLDRIDELVGRAGGRLLIAGNRRALPSGIEVSAYRIVAELMQALHSSGEPVDVQLRFSAEALELQVTGSPRPGDEAGPELTVVRQRLAVHGGSLRSDGLMGRLRWVAQLPLTPEHG